ncbi:hypothetical protein [Streptomyces sp. HUAS ZL42]|uniref:hypothetical protein n=1 Tax=Streptomyces sp. HUAS ZL42 TaxID=3231715 RepID=UPI00345E57B2
MVVVDGVRGCGDGFSAPVRNRTLERLPHAIHPTSVEAVPTILHMAARAPSLTAWTSSR